MTVFYEEYYQRIPIKLWTNSIDAGAMEQALYLSNLPFAFKHIALMPDVHQGYGMPIGGVLAAKNTVIPNAVGVDIGCGVAAARTNIRSVSRNDLKKIVDQIKRDIPVGMNRHKEPYDETLLPHYNKHTIVAQNWNNALTSLGTLGGGNHFIEIQKGTDGHIWVMVHSGSRNLGKQVADHYNRKAIKLNEMWHSSVAKKADLAFLPLFSNEGIDYMDEMDYCVSYAEANRRVMLDIIFEAFSMHMPDFKVDGIHDVAHNYARIENHFGENVVIHRKGATSAKNGEVGIIPGSQGTKSYITEGRGNHQSFMSCSHGAGRTMGRKAAQNTLNLAQQQKLMNDKGILHSIKSEKDLDEAPGAYKDIDVVMENQRDLVNILVELTPLAVIKG